MSDPMDPPSSFILGIFQVRILEWVAISYSREIFLTKGSNSNLLHLLHCQEGFFFLPLRHLSDSWESRSSISSIDKLLLCEACCEVLPRYPFRMKDLFLIPATGRKLWVSPTSGIPLAEEETSPKVIPSSVGSHIQWLISEPWPSTLGKTEQSSQPLSFWHYGWWGLHQSTGHHGFSPYSTMGPFLPFHRCWF